MRTLMFLILLIPLFVFGQTKYFLPVNIESSNGRPLLDKDVDLYTAGTSTKVTDCTWNKGSAYYYTTPPTAGLYDIYVDGVSHMTNVYVGNEDADALTANWRIDIADTSDVIETQLRSDVNDSLKATIAGQEVNIREHLVNLDFTVPKDYDASAGVGSNDDTDAINTCLANAGHVFLPRPTDGRYEISEALRIKSNTMLEIEPGTEIYLQSSSNCYMLENYNLEGGVLDSNIVISGGQWNGNLAGNGSNVSYPGWPGHVTWLDSVKNLVVENTFVTNYNRYAWMFSHINRGRFYNNGFNGRKDGFHFSVGNDLIVKDTYGHTEDDMIAFTISNYPSVYLGNDGDMTDITVDGVQAYAFSGQTYGAQNIVAFIGCGDNSYKFKNVNVRNLFGTTNTYAIRMQTGAAGGSYFPDGEQFTYIEDFLIENIAVKSLGDYATILAKPTTSKNLTIRNISIPENYMGGVILGDSTSGNTYTDTRIENIHGPDSSKTMVYFNTDSTTFINTYISDISGKNAINATTYLVNLGNATFEGGITFRNIRADSIPVFLANSGSIIDFIELQNFYIKDVVTPIKFYSGSDDTTYVSFSNGTFDNCTYSVRVYGTDKIFRLIGSGINYVGDPAIVGTDNLGTLSINNPDLWMYTNQLSPWDNDRVSARTASTNASPGAIVIWNDTDSLWHQHNSKYRILSFAYDPPSIPGNYYTTTDFTITNANTTEDLVFVDAPVSLQAYYTYNVNISAASTVTLTLVNNDSTAHDSAEMTWRIMYYDEP